MDVLLGVAVTVSVICLFLLALFGGRPTRIAIAALFAVMWMLVGLLVVFATFYGE